jgi:hypothetical protein
MEQTKFNPSEVRYIKLGRNSQYAEQAFQDGLLLLSHRSVPHELCSAGAWDVVREDQLATGEAGANVTRKINELRAFYELDDDTLWITFANGHLYWCFASGPAEAYEVVNDDDPRRLRRTRDDWHRTALTGEALTSRSLSSSLTKVANYRATICSVKPVEYLLRRIRGDFDPLHQQADKLRGSMLETTLAMIQKLDPTEFETLVDLIFLRGGWQRAGVLGKSIPDVDLIVEQPATGETAWIQVKSGATQAMLEDYLARFTADGSCDRFFFACHSPKGPLSLPDEPHLHLWTGEPLARAALAAGLFDWLIERSA